MVLMFTRAATFAVSLMIATAMLGLWIGDLHGQTAPDVLRWGTVHRLSGVLAALMGVLVNSMAVTYFIGTGRWCREVVETYQLSERFVDRSKVLKQRAFPFAIAGVFLVIAIIILGGAADPATGRPGTQAWVTPHLIGSITCVTLIAICFSRQVDAIRNQQILIEDVMANVRTIRIDRGLEVDDQAVTSEKTSPQE